jgi:hypothetical protein
MPNVVKALKAIQEGLSQCASADDVQELRRQVMGMATTQNAVLVALLRVAEANLGLQPPDMARMIDAALKGGEPEKWFETLGDGSGKG